jgi:hypothetical protein
LIGRGAKRVMIFRMTLSGNLEIIHVMQLLWHILFALFDGLATCVTVLRTECGFVLSSSFIRNTVFSSKCSVSYIYTETQIYIHVRCPLSGLASTSLNGATINEKI